VSGYAPLLDRIRRIRGVDERHHFTLMCRDLSEIATYARVDNSQYRLLKAVTPGPYTFILEGTKELPRRVLHPKRKTIGLRVPEHAVAWRCSKNRRAAADLDPDPARRRGPLTDPDEIRDRLEKQVDLVIDAGYCGPEDHGDQPDRRAPELVRAGQGPLEPFGLG
jgi:tRNA threonylcarbamoyl adenosine modification protein (Sua5/YciO/YrdC/YwlC family)